MSIKTELDKLEANIETIADNLEARGMVVTERTMKGLIDATAPDVPWYLNQTYLNSLTEDDIGTEINEVEVNGQIHRVRLIGVDHDDLATGGKAHTTWEFMDILSDSDGYSYGIVWNDTNDTGSANYDYTNSSIRKALNGTGNATKFLWARKGQTTFDSESRTVLQMLPTSLQNAIKTVKKQVNVNSGGTWGLVEFTDKLFLLATKEMGYSSQDAEDLPTYKFYEGHTSQTDAIRIKKQINGTEVLTSSSQIPSGSGQLYQGTVYNYAGYNYKADDTGGGVYWTRSPYVSSSYSAWYVYRDGNLIDNLVYSTASGVAPAFCL